MVVIVVAVTGRLEDSVRTALECDEAGLFQYSSGYRGFHQGCSLDFRRIVGGITWKTTGSRTEDFSSLAVDDASAGTSWALLPLSLRVRSGPPPKSNWGTLGVSSAGGSGGIC